MKKVFFIVLSVLLMLPYSAEIFAETIMAEKGNGNKAHVFPDLGDYSLEHSTENNLPDSKLSPAIWPFTRSETSQIKPKSSRKAFFLSLLLPGMGEAYVGGSKRGLLFLGVEALSWWMYLTNTSEGNDIEDDFELFADTHWHYYYEDPTEADKYNYWEYIKNEYEIPADIGPDDYEAINEYIEDETSTGGAASVHNLPATPTQQYYEMIGKYDQFVYGWEDILYLNDSLKDADGNSTGNYDEDTSIIDSSFRDKYNSMRGDSNDKLRAGQRGIQIMLINRIFSAVSAARLAYHHNKKLDSDLSMIQIHVTQKHIIDHKVPMLMFSKKF